VGILLSNLMLPFAGRLEFKRDGGKRLGVKEKHTSLEKSKGVETEGSTN
jgi:hypothetical protein